VGTALGLHLEVLAGFYTLRMIELRAVCFQDLDVICRQRRRMFEEAGFAIADLDLMVESFPAWLRPRLADGRYFGFVGEDAGRAVAGVGLVLLEWPPHPLHPTTEVRGYVLNVFVEPEYRGQGLAQRLMERSEEEFRARGVTYATLHASRMGRPVYEKMGWGSTTEMSKRLG
jgi:GNAT superfamily N-acetyltransferase